MTSVVSGNPSDDLTLNLLIVMVGFLGLSIYVFVMRFPSHSQNGSPYAFHSCASFTSENDCIVICESQLTNRNSNEKQVCFIYETFLTTLPIKKRIDT